MTGGTPSWPATPASSAVFADDLLADEVALITGGGTGIGRAIALAMADHGAAVAVASRDRDHLDPVVETIESDGGRGYATTVDIRESEEVAEMVEGVEGSLGPITILVNNAGATFLSPTDQLSTNGWRAVVGTSLDGTAYCTMQVGTRMIEHGGGSIVSIGATNALRGAPFHAHSGAAKAGVHNLMRSIAAEWAGHGIRANTVVPGIVQTEGSREMLAGELGDQIVEDDLAVDRLAVPADCVPSVLFLASDAAAYVTGSCLVVDGGQLLSPVPG